MSNNSLTDLTKFIEYSHALMQEKTYHTAPSIDYYPPSVKLALSPPPTEESPLPILSHNIPEELINQANDLALKTGQAPEFVLADLARRNTAWLVLQNFLITDLLVKGSLLTFNFWLFRNKNQNPQEQNFQES